MIHLDSSFLIQALVRGSSADKRLRDWLQTSEPLSMSAIARAEFLCGPIDAAELKMATGIIKRHSNFTQEQSVIAARLFPDSGRRCGMFIDCMIAASALFEGAPSATAKLTDFHHFEAYGLKIAC